METLDPFAEPIWVGVRDQTPIPAGTVFRTPSMQDVQGIIIRINLSICYSPGISNLRNLFVLGTS